MPVSVEVRGHGANVRIEVVGYENPAAENVSDSNWLTCRVHVNIAGFEAHVLAAFTTQDFAAFSRSLRSAVADLNGEAKFETDEETLLLTATFNTSGSVSVIGAVREPNRKGTFLSFSFETDQTFMGHAVDALSEVTRQFPIRV